MARDDFRQPRRQGWKPSSGFENLERALGLVADIAGGVRAKREERGNAIQRDMRLIVGNNGENYKRLINVGDVNELKSRLETLQARVETSDVDTSGLYEFFKKDIDKHVEDIAKYDTDKAIIEGLESELQSGVKDYIDNQAGYDEATQKMMAAEFDEKLKSYVKTKESFFVQKDLETIILKYVSDGLGTDSEMVIHKFCEEACYKWIMYGVLSGRSNIPEYLVNRFKKEKFAETRKAKIRLSNIKIEEFTQVLKGMSKQIK